MTGNSTTEPELTRDEFLMIRDFIHEKCGIFFPENKMYLLTNRLSRRMADLGIKSYRDYFYQVKYDASLVEFNQLMNLITTNETSFFRNEPQLLSFSDEVLPLLVQQKSNDKGTKTLRIWSAGCSTGEEPYTLAVIILERLKSLAGWNIEIIANDISESVLQRARQGEYSGITLRNMKPDMLSKYFTQHGDNYRVNNEIRTLVKFSHLNLNDPVKITMNANFDAVFCRNVMIYFSDEIKLALVRNFYNSLRPGGYFYIGHSETLHGVSKAFKLVYFKNALVYHKEAVGTAAAPFANALTPIRAAVAAGAELTNTASGASRALDLLTKIKPMAVKK